jgi:hypothetical protein
MVAYGGADYASLKTKLAAGEALNVIDFTFRTLDDIVALISEHGWEEDVEYRPVVRIRTFGDTESLAAAKTSVAEFVAQRPEMHGAYRFIGAEQTRKAGRFHLPFGSNQRRVHDHY